MKRVAMLALFVIPAAQVAALDLVIEGRSDYAIVMAADAIPAEQSAAEELVLHLEKISGAKLPIVTDAEPLPRHAILLGRGRYLAQLKVQPEYSTAKSLCCVGDRLQNLSVMTTCIAGLSEINEVQETLSD